MRAGEELFPDVKALRLYTGEKDEKNIHFYISQGYEITGKGRLGTIDFVYMEKKN